MWKGARVRGRCHPYKRRPETPLRRRGAARSCRWTPLSSRERLNLMPSRRLSGERGRDAPRKAHLLGAPAEGLRAVSGVSEATCDSLAWWDALWQERDAHHRNWNGVTYVGAYRPLSMCHGGHHQSTISSHVLSLSHAENRTWQLWHRRNRRPHTRACSSSTACCGRGKSGSSRIF